MKLGCSRQGFGLVGAALVSTALLVDSSSAQQDEAQATEVPLEVSINAVMVASVDHAAHLIWEAAAEQTLTGQDWQLVEQHAIQLIGTGTLISLGGTGPLDSEWVEDPMWQTWAREYTDSTHAAMAAVEAKDQSALAAAGDRLVETCNGCHDDFKPEVPTEGLLHIPYYDEL